MATEEYGIAVTIDAQLERFEKNMRKAGQVVETSVSGMDKQTQRAAKQFQRLEGRLDPTARAAQRLSRDTEKVQRALDKGAISSERAAQVQKRLNDQYEAAVSRTNQLNAAQDRLSSAAQRSIAQRTRLNGVYDRSITQLGQLAARSQRVATDQQLVNTRLAAGTRQLSTAARSTSRFGVAAQNAGFQIGDFATQVASGQSATRALAQQLPQLVGGFGPLGAVLGAAVAVGGALVPTLTNIGEETKDADDATSNYAESLEAANTLIERLNNAGKTRIERLRQEAKEALEGAKATVQANEARLEELRIRNEQDLRGAGRRQRSEREEAEAAEELAASQERLAELRERLNKALEQEKDRLEDSTEATEANTAAQTTNAEVRQSVASRLREQIELQELEGRERFQTQKVMEAQNRAMENGNLLREEEIERVRRLAGELFDARNATEDVTDAQKKAQDAMNNFGIETESTAEIVTGAMEDAGKSAQREFAA